MAAHSSHPQPHATPRFKFNGRHCCQGDMLYVVRSKRTLNTFRQDVPSTAGAVRGGENQADLADMGASWGLPVASQAFETERKGKMLTFTVQTVDELSWSLRRRWRSAALRFLHHHGCRGGGTWGGCRGGVMDDKSSLQTHSLPGWSV